MTDEEDRCLTNLARVVAGVERLPRESAESVRMRCFYAMKRHDEETRAAYFDPVKFTCRECGIDGYGKEGKPIGWYSPRFCCTECMWDYVGKNT